MAKERSFNPVQAQRKADKAKAIKKGKSELQARRNEKLAQRNPQRLEKQIDDLKALKESGGKLTAVEEQSLEALEKDLKAVKKAREALGDRAPTFARGPSRQGGDGAGGGGVLGKRRRDAEDASSDDSDVPDDVKKIPMPRDTPPPIPKEVLDGWWAKRRGRRTRNANLEPLAEREGRPGRSEQPAPAVEAKTVYEAKPAVRDLRKEAVSAFVPNVIRTKLDKSKGKAGLLEPEEFDQLEKEGYVNGTASSQGAVEPTKGLRQVTIEEVEDDE